MPKPTVMKFQSTRDKVSNIPSQEAIRICAPARQGSSQKNTRDPGNRGSSRTLMKQISRMKMEGKPRVETG